MKFVKFLFKSVLVVLILALGALGLKFYQSKTRIIPYPYTVNIPIDNDFQTSLGKAEKSKVLIVGDRMGLQLNAGLKSLEEKINAELKTNLNFYNWSSEKESLPRTLFKLKQLKKFPPIIIYHGASEEFYEKKFHLSERDAIIKNFKLYDDDRILSSIITVPELSRLIYANDQQIILGKTISKDSTIYQEGQRVLQKELMYKLFEYEFRELVELIKTNNAILITIVSPINLEVAPKEICAEVNTNSIIEAHQEVSDLLKKGEAKEAHTIIKEISNIVVGNAETSYLLGMSALKLGDLQTARTALSYAVSFDCRPERGDPVFNEIIRRESAKLVSFVIDFDQTGKSMLGNDSFFLNDLFPHALFYEKLNDEIAVVLKKILNIK